MSICILLFLFHIHLFLCVLTLVTCILIDWFLLYWCTVPNRSNCQQACCLIAVLSLWSRQLTATGCRPAASLQPVQQDCRFIAYFCLSFGHAVERIPQSGLIIMCIACFGVDTFVQRESQPVLGGWRESAAVSFRFTHQPGVCISLDTSVWHFSLFIFMLIHFFNDNDKKHFYR